MDEIKTILADAIRERRKALGLTQWDLAKLLDSNQSIVSKIERRFCSVDAMLRALLALGLSQKQIGQLIAQD